MSCEDLGAAAQLFAYLAGFACVILALGVACFLGVVVEHYASSRKKQ